MQKTPKNCFIEKKRPTMSDNYHYEDGAIHYDHKRVLHIGHVGSSDAGRLIGAFLKAEAEDAEVVEEASNAEQPAPAPPCGVLASEQAARYWHSLQEAGFVDGSCRLLPATTRKQAMYIAESFAEKLDIKSKWKTFERFWGISNLAQEKWDFQQTGASPSRSKEIDRIFSD